MTQGSPNNYLGNLLGGSLAISGGLLTTELDVTESVEVLSSVAYIDFVVDFANKEYDFMLDTVSPSADSGVLIMEFGSGLGVSFVAAGDLRGMYSEAVSWNNTAAGGIQISSVGNIPLATDTKTGFHGSNGIIQVRSRHLIGGIAATSTSNNYRSRFFTSVFLSGYPTTTTVRFSFSTSNIASGTIIINERGL